jgi:hypothetical protein
MGEPASAGERSFLSPVKTGSQIPTPAPVVPRVNPWATVLTPGYAGGASYAVAAKINRRLKSVLRRIGFGLCAPVSLVSRFLFRPFNPDHGRFEAARR